MSEKIKNLRDKLRVRLTGVDDRINSLKADIESASATAKADIESRIEAAKTGLEAHKQQAEQAQARLKVMLEEKKEQTEAKIQDWIRNREVEKLEARAQLAEDYAAEQVWLAMVAVEEAEYATLEALAKRIEADEVVAA